METNDKVYGNVIHKPYRRHNGVKDKTIKSKLKLGNIGLDEVIKIK